jgi:hypothetical protein
MKDIKITNYLTNKYKRYLSIHTCQDFTRSLEEKDQQGTVNMSITTD